MNWKPSIFLLSFFNIAVIAVVISICRSGGPSVDFLSVGQGDASLISTSKGLTVLIDGGPNTDILRSLEKALGRDKRLDIVILTHPHSDHYGGLIDVLKAYNVGVVLTSGEKSSDPAFLEFIDLMNIKGVRSIGLSSGDKVFIDEAKIDVLSPFSDTELLDPNSSSLVVIIEENGAKFLFTGDIGQKEEKQLVQSFDIKADVLKVPHHGSNGSSSESFLSEVRPDISVVEVGKNGYGMPRSEVLDRLRSVGSIVYRTDVDGSIRITPSDKGLKVFGLR